MDPMELSDDNWWYYEGQVRVKRDTFVLSAAERAAAEAAVLIAEANDEIRQARAKRAWAVAMAESKGVAFAYLRSPDTASDDDDDDAKEDKLPEPSPSKRLRLEDSDVKQRRPSLRSSSPSSEEKEEVAGSNTPLSATHKDCKVHDRLVRYTDFEEDVKLIDSAMGMLNRDCAIEIARFAGRHIIEPLLLSQDVLAHSIIKQWDQDFVTQAIYDISGVKEFCVDGKLTAVDHAAQELCNLWGDDQSPLTAMLALELHSWEGSNVQFIVTHQDCSRSVFIDVVGTNVGSGCFICPLCYTDLSCEKDHHKSCTFKQLEPRLTLDAKGLCDRPIMDSYICIPAASDIEQFHTRAFGVKYEGTIRLQFDDIRPRYAVVAADPDSEPVKMVTE
jgi:hypothetical protein